MARITVVATGLANLASVRAAFERLGHDVVTTVDPGEIVNAERVVLPGVGAFGPAMEALRARESDVALRARADADRPTLGICLGFQLFAAASEEAPGVPGLGLLEGVVLERFTVARRVPHMGWTAVESTNGADCSSGVYFAHSYFAPHVPPGWSAAFATHGERFVAAAERGAVLLCQFHPELSGSSGAALLARWTLGREALS